MFKTRFDTFGNDFGHIWNFANFLIFWNHFEDSTLHGTLRKMKSPKKVPQNMFKTLLVKLGTTLGVFGILNFFSISLKTFQRLDPPWNTGQKKFSKKIPQNLFKTRLGTFGNDFRHFWNFANFLIFWNHFEDSTLHGKLGKKIYQKNYPKTCSKHVWTDWERYWAFFEFWKFFENISKSRPSLEQWAKKFFKKITPKHVENTFGQFGDDFGRFLVFEFF